MASPFSIFRRNQKVMMAVVTVASMFAFVILGPLVQYAGRSTQQTDAVVVQTRYGDFHESELATMRHSRNITEEFVKRLVDAAVNELASKQKLDDRTIQMIHNNALQNALQFRIRSKPGAEEAAVETYVLAKRAEQLGIVVSDVTINDFLKQITGNSLSGAQITQIISQLKVQGPPMSQGRLFDALRDELLAWELIQIFDVGVAAVPPGQRWDYFERIHRRANVELLALPVANYLSEVKDPKDSELQSFFDKYKNRLPDPSSPDPGFKQPRKAEFQYFKADFDEFVARASAQVTEKQIKDYYEAHKDARFREVKLPPESDTPDSKPQTPEGKEGAAPGDAAKPAEPKPDAASATPAPGSAAPAAQPAAPAATPATPAVPANPAAPATPATPATPPAPKAEPEKNPKSAAVPDKQGSTVRLVSAPETLIAQATPPAATPPAAAAAAPAAAPQASPPPAAAPPATTPPTAAAPTGTPPAAAPASQAAPAATPPDATPPATTPAAPSAEKPPADQAKTETPAEPVKYEPLDKVKDVIRKDLARGEAREQISKALEQLDAVMKQYADDLTLYESQGDTELKGTPPTPLDFAALAKEHGVKAEQTDGLISAEEARDATDIGKSYVRAADPRSRFGLQFFDQFAFDDALLKYKPVQSQDISANFLFWKIKSVEEQVPDLKTIRPQVERAWKMIEARKISQEKAEKYLAEAKRDKATLEETFGKQPELKVLKPLMFSWMTMGNVPHDPSANQPRLSDVVGVDQPGNSFMKTVFNLNPDEFAVTMNQPETTTYVVRLVSFDRALDSLFEQFASERFDRYMAVGIGDRQRAFQGWIEGLMTEAKVHWEREPVVERNRS